MLGLNLTFLFALNVERERAHFRLTTQTEAWLSLCVDRGLILYSDLNL